MVEKSQGEKDLDEQRALGYVYGAIPIVIASVLGIGIYFYYEGGWFSFLIYIILFVIFSYRLFHKAQVVKHYREMSPAQKKPLLALVLWEAFCFGAPWFFSIDGGEYVINLLALLLISGIPFYIIYMKIRNKN